MRNPSKVQTDSAGDETAESATASLFTTSAIEKLLEQVAHAAQFTGGIQVVEGPHASGKSTLAKQLCDKHLSHAALLGFIHISAGLDVHSVLLASAQALGLPAKEAHLPGELMASLRSLAQSLQVQSQVSVLVIDDAHRLDQQALGALVSLLQGGGESVFGLHLVLWSEPGLVERRDARRELVGRQAHARLVLEPDRLLGAGDDDGRAQRRGRALPTARRVAPPRVRPRGRADALRRGRRRLRDAGDQPRRQPSSPERRRREM